MNNIFKYKGGKKMKKAFKEAELMELNITATAGGQIYDNVVDGDAWYNEEQGRWETPSGHNPTNS